MSKTKKLESKLGCEEDNCIILRCKRLGVKVWETIKFYRELIVTQEDYVAACENSLMSYICVHVPMSPRARTSVPDEW